MPQVRNDTAPLALNTRSTPMKQNLRDKAFVAFVCLVGKPLLPKIVVGNHRPKKSSQSAMNLAYGSADRFPAIRLKATHPWTSYRPKVLHAVMY